MRLKPHKDLTDDPPRTRPTEIKNNIMSYEELKTVINRNFVIRYKYDTSSKTYLIGAGNYYKLLEDKKLALKHFNKALNSAMDKTTIKLRRGLKIDFCSK